MDPVPAHIDALKSSWEALRPQRGEAPGERLDAFIESLRDDAERLEEVRAMVGGFVQNTRLVHSLAESGILPDRSFSIGISTRLRERLFPMPRSLTGLGGALGYLLGPKDWVWVKEAGVERWAELLDLLLPKGERLEDLHSDIPPALQGLAQRIGALGIDEEVNARIPEVEDYHSPFLDITPHVFTFLQNHHPGADNEAAWEALIASMRDCCRIVVRLRSKRQQWGTSIHITRMSRRLMQQISRLELLARLVRPDDRRDLVNSMASLFVDLIKGEQTEHDIVRFIKENVDLLAYQVTEETAAKGVKYVTQTSEGYWKFLRAATAGGVIVAFFAMIKLWLSKQGLPLAIEAIAYSLNYALCFVLIYVTGSILATKQPAVTASALARCLDTEAERDPGLVRVADMVVAIWRSQFISFVGNLIAAFPIAALLTLGLMQLQLPIATGDKPAKLLASVDPIGSGALIYAAVAGIFLFASGIIAGVVNNRMTYIDLKSRLEEMLSFLGDKGHTIARWTTDNLSMVVSNITLGFALGCTGTIGVLLGLPIDIRHIAFSSANVGIAAVSEPELMVWTTALISLVGVLGIGFINFLVSFGLTLSMTLESRQLSLKQNSHLLQLLAQRAFQTPLSWFYPTTNSREAPPESEAQPNT